MLPQRRFVSETAYTLVELLVVIATVAILCSILFPAFVSARKKVQQTNCTANIRQIGMSIIQYAQDNDERFPLGGYNTASGGTTAGRWYKDIVPYIKNAEAFYCPAQTGGQFRPIFGSGSTSPSVSIRPGPNVPGGYGINYNLSGWTTSHSLHEVQDTAGTFLACDGAQLTRQATLDTAIRVTPKQWSDYQDSPTDWQVMPPGEWDNNNTAYYIKGADDYCNQCRRPIGRHQGTLTILYVDGHVAKKLIDDFLGVTTKNPKGWEYGDKRNSWDNSDGAITK